MRSLILFTLFVAVFSLRTFAQNYTVTSNADSGPGTLRQGLLDAATTATAGRTTAFSISFSLPGIGTDYNNRTIRLRSALPVVASNTIIDGSSQASWTPLGVSGAKIILEPEFANTTFSGLIIGSNNGLQTTGVEIYGLVIRNFAAITNLQTVNMSQGSGIVIDYRSNNITIGAPGKGNVIGGNIYGINIQNSTSFTTVNPIKIKIQSNIVGLIYDGITPQTNVIGIATNLYDCALDIGGDNAGEGNIVAANRINIDINRSFTTSARFDINVISNKIGVDYTGQKDFHDLPMFLSAPSSLEISGLKVNAVNSALYIRNNIIGGNRTVGVSINNSDFVLTGNVIGSDITGNVAMGNGIGVKIEANATGTIGGTTAEKNIIANNDYGIETVSAKPVKITRNSMFCNRKSGIGKTLTNLQPFIQILKKRNNYVSGKATANSEIELFYNTNCSGICEGKTYVTTVQAGSDGRWEYNGTLNSDVIATASLLNATTSPFSTTELLTTQGVLEPVTCNNKGSVTFTEQTEGLTYSWVKIEDNGQKTPWGTQQNISNLEVGTYEVTINDGCKDFSYRYEVKDQALTKPTIATPAPLCGQTSFTVSASVFRGKGALTYKWYSSANPATVIRTGNPVTVPEGNYFVEVTDEANCKLSSQNLQITRLPQPKLKKINTPVPASCGKDNGSITGLDLDDVTGTATYEWHKYISGTGTIDPAVITTDRELLNVPSGSYVVKVADGGSCPVTFGPYIVGVLNDVLVGNVLPTPTTCNNNNGTIPSPSISNANYYIWKDGTGATIKQGAYSAGLAIGLTGLASGTYRLIGQNTVGGCENFRDFTVNATPKLVYTFTPQKNPATCELNNGSIKITYNTLVRPAKFEWRNEFGVVFPGTITEVKNLPPGNYTYNLEDINGCSDSFGPYEIIAVPKLAITPGSGFAVDDQCNLKRGSVTKVQVVGGIQANYTFKWINDKGDAVQYTQDLIDVQPGTYRLIVEDGTSCPATSDPFTIGNQVLQIQAPNVADIRVCYVSDITLPVIGAQEGTYQLFADPAAGSPILETTNGVFKFRVSKTADYYVRRKLGSCISDFTKMHIEVTYDNLEIGNVITPNGDGLNDYWMLNGLPDYKGNNVKIYTRAGQLVYESIGNYIKPFDGTFRDKQLPAGVYFYVIDLRAECKPISGSITLLR